jgi:hypothetical protein
MSSVLQAPSPGPTTTPWQIPTHTDSRERDGGWPGIDPLTASVRPE